MPYVVAHYKSALLRGLTELQVEAFWAEILKIIEEELRWEDEDGSEVRYDPAAGSHFFPFEHTPGTVSSIELFLKIEANDVYQRRINKPERSTKIKRRVENLFPRKILTSVKLDLTPYGWSSDN